VADSPAAGALLMAAAVAAVDRTDDISPGRKFYFPGLKIEAWGTQIVNI
jgi:hypothetical protein